MPGTEAASRKPRWACDDMPSRQANDMGHEETWTVELGACVWRCQALLDAGCRVVSGVMFLPDLVKVGEVGRRCDRSHLLVAKIDTV